MDLVLVFGGDWADIWKNYMGPSVYECLMVVPLKEDSEELREKVNLFNDTEGKSIFQKELVKYCIDNKLVTSKNTEHMLKDFYDLK